MTDFELIPQVVELARRAGAAILPFWRADVAVTSKADESPVTAADLAAHKVIAEGVQALAPQLLLTSNIGCRLHLGAGLAAVETLHPVTLLARQLKAPPPGPTGSPAD